MTSQTNIPASCAQLTARLVVEGCLPIIQGNVKGQVGADPVVLTPEERNRLGLSPGGSTVFYPAGEHGVFMDLAQSEFALWFTGSECLTATTVFHDALLRAFPQSKQLDDVPHQADPRMRARAYQVELKGGRLAAISTSFFSTAQGVPIFRVHIIAQQRMGN